MAFQVSPGVNVSEIDTTTSVPGIAASVGGIAGVFRWGPVGERVLIDSESKLASTFGKPTSLNAETFLTAANYLSYSSALIVSRAANTTADSNSTLSAVANTVASVNNVSYTVKNRVDYDTKTFANGDVLYVARYPGDLGNSLRVSVVDNVTAYQSNVLLAAANSTVSNAVLSIAVGSNTATLEVTVAANGAAANVAANTFLTALNIGDVLTIGNSTIGTQYMKITAKSAPAANASNVASATISFASTYKLAANFTFVGSNTVNTTVQRSWEFFDVVDTAPRTSDYQAQFGGNTSAIDTMHVVVVDEDGKFGGVSGAILEVFQNVSRATDAKSPTGASNYYKNVINDGSSYIFVAGDRAGASSAASANLASSSNTTPAYISFVGGTDGLDEATVAFTDIASAYDLFKTPDVDVSLILQGKPVGGVNSAQLANYLINNIAEVRKDCVVFITPPDSLASTNVGNEAATIANWRNTALVDSTYAFIDSGYKYMYDRYNDVYRFVPLNGDIAGITARTEFTNDAWWSPAGFNRGQVKNVVKLRWNPTKADRDVLFKSAVNPVATFPGQGTVLFGDKTATSKTSAFDRLNVRRLFIVLEKAIANASRFSLFEFNDEFTRAQFRNLVVPYLRDVQARRGITDFYVVCDESNNTPERVDRNEFWGDIYIKPARSISYIQLNFVAVRTGVEFNTVIGRF